MSKTVKYDVLREHEGDRFYRRGESRELKADEAKQLVGLGVLAEHDPDRWKNLKSSTALSAVDARKTEIDTLIEAENQRLDEARAAVEIALKKIEDDFATAKTDAENETLGITQAVADARAKADEDLKEIEAMVEKARTDATAEIDKVKADVEKAKAEPKVANKAEQVPNNKAG